MKERYKDNPLTHLDINPDLWLKAGLFDGPDRNRVYKLSNTKIENLQMTHSASTIGCLQSIPSTETPEFEAILDQRVKDRITHLVADYEWLSVETTKLRWLVSKMRSQMSSVVLPYIFSTVQAKTLLIQRLYSWLIVFKLINI